MKYASGGGFVSGDLAQAIVTAGPKDGSHVQSNGVQQ